MAKLQIIKSNFDYSAYSTAENDESAAYETHIKTAAIATLPNASKLMR